MPFEFQIGQLNTMIEGSVFEGSLTLTARLDQDGNRKSSPGDIEGTANVQAGEKNVILEAFKPGSAPTGEAYVLRGQTAEQGLGAGSITGTGGLY